MIGNLAYQFWCKILLAQIENSELNLAGSHKSIETRVLNTCFLVEINSETCRHCENFQNQLIHEKSKFYSFIELIYLGGIRQRGSFKCVTEIVR